MSWIDRLLPRRAARKAVEAELSTLRGQVTRMHVQGIADGLSNLSRATWSNNMGEPRHLVELRQHFVAVTAMHPDSLMEARVAKQVEELHAEVSSLEQRAITELPWNVGQDPDLVAHVPTPQKSLRLAPVYGAVSMIARSISTMPVHAYRKTGESRARMQRLPQLFSKPSVHGEISDWLHRCLTSLLLTGNAYGLITARDGFGYPTMIEWLEPQQVSVIDQNMWGRGSFWDPIYYWRGRIVDAENLVHIPWFSLPFRVRGLSPISAYAASVEVGLAGQKFTRDWYNSGGVPPGTFKNDNQSVGEPEAAQIKQRLVSAVRSHEPMVYGKEWTYTPIQVSPADAAFVESHQLTANDIAVVYGIYPAERIGGQTKSNLTYSNVEAEQIQWVNITLLPYVSKLESYFFDLLPEPQYVKFQLDSQIRSDTKTRHEIYQIDREIGLINIDEARDKEDMPPLPNGEGQVYTPLVAVHELVRAAAITTGDPNEPGFEAGEPTPAAPGKVPGGAPEPTTTAMVTSSTNGRFMGQVGELQPVGSAKQSDEDQQ